MSSFDPAELSALLDGELDPERASVVHRAIAGDPALRAEFELLERLDRSVAEAAATAAFQARVVIPKGIPENRLPRSIAASGLLLAALPVVHFLPKLLDLALPMSMLLHFSTFALVMAWTVRLVMRSDEEFPADPGNAATSHVT